MFLYLRLAIEERYIEGWVEGCLETIGEDNPEEEEIFRDLWEDETQREVVNQVAREKGDAIRSHAENGGRAVLTLTT